ncbi:MAG: hypothetical protein ACUVX8_08030 [Candidatus Zipacnadales bacterium]
MATIIRRMPALKVTIGDRIGALADVLAAARNAGIDLISIDGYVDGGQGVILGIPANIAAARPAVVGAPFAIAEQEVLWIEGEDRRGALCEITEKLAQAGIYIEAAHAIAIEGKFGAVLCVASKDIDRAAELLGV